MMRSLKFAACASLVWVSAAGCAAKDDSASVEQSAAELAVDSSESAQTEGAVLASFLEGAELAPGVAAPTAEDVATRIMARIKARYVPASCVTVTQTGFNLDVALNGCTGPRGLRTLNGNIHVVASILGGGEYQAVATAQDLNVNAATLDLNATAVYSPTAKTLAVTTQGAGVGAMGNEILRQGDYTVQYDANCAKVTGAWSTAVGEATRSTEVVLQRCKDQCPSGQVVHTGRLGRVTTVTFDGSAQARWATSTGKSGTLALPCGS